MIRRLFGLIILGEFPEAKIDQAANGDEAVEACKARRYDLIIMDLQMPVRDGREAYGAIEELCLMKGCPVPRVVFCTGFTPPESLQAIIRDNPLHCLIRKPVKVENLLNCVRKLIKP
jgi:CheY-like chemotaxis protein